MRILPLAFLTLLAGCRLFTSGDPIDCICTEEFRTLTVRVVDTAGAPVDGLTSTVRNERTGRVLDVQAEPFEPGLYALASDAQIDELSVRGDRLRFQAEGRGLVAEADFVVGVDACRCHVEQRSGPENVVAR